LTVPEAAASSVFQGILGILTIVLNGCTSLFQKSRSIDLKTELRASSEQKEEAKKVTATTRTE